MTMTEEEAHRFSDWLQARTELQVRSIRDVVSRTRRLLTMVDPVKSWSREELTYRLSLRSDYSEATPAVRSQLKRAAELYRMFKAEESEGRQ
jgi:hypothetical protein